MENSYTVRKIDELGRVVLPIELRKQADLDIRDSVSVQHNAADNTIILKLHEKSQGPKCVFCGASEAAVTRNGKDVCAACLKEIQTA